MCLCIPLSLPPFVMFVSLFHVSFPYLAIYLPVSMVACPFLYLCVLPSVSLYFGKSLVLSILTHQGRDFNKATNTYPRLHPGLIIFTCTVYVQMRLNTLPHQLYLLTTSLYCVGAEVQLGPGGGRCEGYNTVYLRCINESKSQVNSICILALLESPCIVC